MIMDTSAPEIIDHEVLLTWPREDLLGLPFVREGIERGLHGEPIVSADRLVIGYPYLMEGAPTAHRRYWFLFKSEVAEVALGSCRCPDDGVLPYSIRPGVPSLPALPVLDLDQVPLTPAEQARRDDAECVYRAALGEQIRHLIRQDSRLPSLRLVH